MLRNRYCRHINGEREREIQRNRYCRHINGERGRERYSVIGIVDMLMEREGERERYYLVVLMCDSTIFAIVNIYYIYIEYRLSRG